MKKAFSLRFSRSAETYNRWAIPQKRSAEILVDMVKPQGSVLDLGCGTGFISELLERSSFRVGVDIAPRMVEAYARKFGLGILGDVENLPIKDKSFDFVLSNFSLHWTNLALSLNSALRVASKGVGIALPVRGSVRELGFPFPSEEEVIEFFKDREAVYIIKNINIPFSGWSLVRFFHHTGSSLNPVRRRLLTRSQIEELINSIEKPFFRVLFLYARVE